MQRNIQDYFSISHSSSYFDGSILNNMEYFRGLFCLQNNQKIQEIEEYSRLFQYLICHHILTDRSSIIWNTFVVFFAWHFIRISLDLFKIEEYSRLFQYLIRHHILTDRSSIIWNTFVVFFAYKTIKKFRRQRNIQDYFNISFVIIF